MMSQRMLAGLSSRGGTEAVRSNETSETEQKGGMIRRREGVRRVGYYGGGGGGQFQRNGVRRRHAAALARGMARSAASRMPAAARWLAGRSSGHSDDGDSSGSRQ
jgi:hypothetical protein